MRESKDQLRDELVAILGASRELSPATDEELADMFLEHLGPQSPPPRQSTDRAPSRRPSTADISRVAAMVVFSTLLVVLPLSLLRTHNGVITLEAVPPMYIVVLLLGGLSVPATTCLAGRPVRSRRKD